jgi:hypothetical protein
MVACTYAVVLWRERPLLALGVSGKGTRGHALRWH